MKIYKLICLILTILFLAVLASCYAKHPGISQDINLQTKEISDTKYQTDKSNETEIRFYL